MDYASKPLLSFPFKFEVTWFLFVQQSFNRILFCQRQLDWPEHKVQFPGSKVHICEAAFLQKGNSA